MRSNHFDRRLVAIAFADVARFSRLIARDEAGAAAKWADVREQSLIPALRKRNGRVVDDAGDALLVEFESCVHAVEWAIEAQQLVEGDPRNAEPPAISLRISVNVDDVVGESGRIYGEGIIIAARIHQAIDSGQIVVTSLVRELVSSRLSVNFKDLGTPRLKNVDRIVHLYQIDDHGTSKNISLHQPYLSWSSRPTVAVMPFRMNPKSTETEYFGEEVTADIIVGLSQSRSFYVIAHSTMARYVNRDRDIRDVAAELGVEYILDGSVRRSGDRIRINAELIDALRNRSIWAQRFEGTGTDLFDLQDQIVSQIVGALNPRLLAAEVDRVKGHPTSNLDAYDCVLKAQSVLFQLNKESFETSGIALERAMALDPFYAQAYAYSAWRLNFLIGEGRSKDPASDTRRASALARYAIELDPEDAFTLAIGGHLLSFIEGKPTEAMSNFDSALRIDENSALAWALSGISLSYLGQAYDARERFRNAFKLSPYDRLNFSFWTGAGLAEFVDGNYEGALEWLRRSYRANPAFIATMRLLCATLGMAGEVDEAKQIAQELLVRDADFQVYRFVKWYPLQRDEDRVCLQRGLLAAGLPG